MSFLRRDKSRSNLRGSSINDLKVSAAGQSDDLGPVSPTTNLFPPGYDTKYGEISSQYVDKTAIDDYSPRSSISVPNSDLGMPEGVKQDYKGFHANRRPQGHANVPPLSRPIKPRFMKKSTSLLGKWIYSSRKDSSDSGDDMPFAHTSHPIGGRHSSTASSSSGHSLSKFRLPSMSSMTHSYQQEKAQSVALPSFDLNLDEMQGIVDKSQSKSETSRGGSVAAITSSPPQPPTVVVVPDDSSRQGVEAAWTAPESWDVKATQAPPEPAQPVEAPKIEELDDESPQPKKFPPIWGMRSSSVVQGGPNNIIRVFREDNTFTTILCPLETTTTELLAIIRKKFFLESVANFSVSAHVCTHFKVMEAFEKPLKVQRGLLTLSGYTDSENLKILGREDLSYIIKFVVEPINLRNLTHDEEVVLSKDYVDVNISGLSLKNIPIIFHQHTYEIERLNVSDNPGIHIPLDFIQSCNNLTSINYSHNGCSKFPVNFLEATSLTRLDMESNFLDELPKDFGRLKNITQLKLKSNQLISLPDSFAELTQLVVLNLSSNYFSEYPEVINQLSELVDLDLSYNDLGQLPSSVARLTKLQKLNLCTNKLRGSLPDCLVAMESLKRLDIRYNLINNVDILGQLPSLEVTYASKNNISKFSDQMEHLRLIHLDKNPVTNLHFGTRLELLTILDLSKAKISSVPPEFVLNIVNVEKVVLDKNHLTTLPEEIGHWHRLMSFSLQGNNLRSLPSSVGQLCQLQYLDLHSNNLQELPEEIWQLKELQYFNLASNILSQFPKPPMELAKRISNSWDNQSDNGSSGSMADSLVSLTLTDNRLNTDCWEVISFLVNLKYLNVSYNEIQEIPEGLLGRLVHLNDLILSGNSLSTLPADEIEQLSQLRLLHLNNNKLVTLPAELASLKNLQHLDVGSNQLKYNIANWPYDWNWQWNTNLRSLNFSGNKRFEIKQTYVKNPDTGEYLDSLACLPKLRVLGLVDVTITTSQVPDQSMETRIRSQSSELPSIGYGVSDYMGTRDHVSMGDLFVQKFRGNDNEVLFCSLDGKFGPQHKGHRILYLVKSIFVQVFSSELDRLAGDETPADALRRAFLTMNKEINAVLAAKKNGTFVPSQTSSYPALAELTLEDDASSGTSLTVTYLKDKQLYSANVGDYEALLSRSNGDHIFLTTKHDPTTRDEFERIRASGGYVSGSGLLNGVLGVSRGVGFFNFIPHTNSGPSITKLSLSSGDDTIVLGNKGLWDHVPYELAVDIIRQEKDDPMLAAQRLRDYAIAYGAIDKVSVTVVQLGDRRSGSKSRLGSYRTNSGSDVRLFKRRNGQGAVTGDSSLRRLDDEIDPPVGNLALVFTDIKNSTWLWDSYSAPMRSAIKIHNTIMRRLLRIVGGYEVKTEGDAFMVSFPTPSSALLWCFNVQQALLAADWPQEILATDQCCEVSDGDGNLLFRGLSVRMGIHWGSPVCEPDVITGRMDYFGPMVNRASRISAVADGGQIAISEDFIEEMETLYKIHEDIASNTTTVSQAYQDKVMGETIEHEIDQLDSIGYKYFGIGEKKLKGLETPETINLAYTDNLQMRFEVFQKRLSESDVKGSHMVGTIPVETIFGLRTMSLRLENVCANADGSNLMSQFFAHSSSLIQRRMSDAFKEAELVELFNHIVLRIENCVTQLTLRQNLSLAQGGNGMIDFRNGPTAAEMLDDFGNIMNQFMAMKSAAIEELE